MISPQVIFVYNKEGKIKKTYFLNNYGDKILKDSYVFTIFNILKNNNKVLYDEYTVLENHIFLSLNIEEVKGYIINILKLNKPIFIFSLFFNIDYYIGNKVFDPFNISGISIINKLDLDSLYFINPEIISKGIFCIIEEDESPNNFITNNLSYGIQNKNISKFLKRVLLNYDYDLDIKTNKQISYSYEFNIKLLLKLLKNNDIKIYFSQVDNDVLYLAGNVLTITTTNESINLIVFENNEENKINIEKSTIDDFDASNNYNKLSTLTTHTEIKEKLEDKIIFYYENNFLVVLNDSVWESLNLNLNNKGKQITFKTIISREHLISNTYSLDIDFDFIIQSNAKTKNIFSDVSKKIMIILSKFHITFRSKVEMSDIAVYLSILIINYFNKGKKIKKQKLKVENNYISRQCQNSKTVLRKPITLTEDFNVNDYIKITENFFQGKTKIVEKFINNKIVKTTVKLSDIYKDNDGIYYKCPTDDTYLGFNPNMKNVFNFCAPCCYTNDKIYDTRTFKECIYNIDSIYKSRLSQYIQVNEVMKPVLIHGKTSLLGSKLNKIFNKNNKITLHKKRIVETDFYVVYIKDNLNISISNHEDLLHFSENKGPMIIIFNDTIMINKIDYNYKYTVYLILKNKLQKLIGISKKKETDKIIEHEFLPKEIIKPIIKKFMDEFNDQQFAFKNKYVNLEFNYNTLYFNNKILKYPKLNGVFEYNIPTKEYSLPYNIDKIITKHKDEFLLTRYLNS